MNLADQNAPATQRQLWTLFTGTGLQTKGLTISLNKASNLISDLKVAERDGSIELFNSVCAELKTLGAKGEPKASAKMRENVFKDLYSLAHEAGMNAVKGLVPVPMTVVGGGKEYFVPDGPCGFGYVCFPGNTSFAKWCMKNKLANKHYPSGYAIYVSQFGQSYQRKARYAQAFAKVLCDNGIKAHAESRLD